MLVRRAWGEAAFALDSSPMGDRRPARGLSRVARFADANEAQVVASALRGAGIPVLMQDEHAGQANFLWQAALGGFGILVPDEYAREAVQFIRQHRIEARAAPEPDSESLSLANDPDWARQAAKRRNMAVRWFVVALFFGPPLLLLVFALCRGAYNAITGAG
ncbi:MAG TPA: hypothetical protein VE309_12875 [Caulobacteraceae bacterium]|jgi:hypothetical protein|nr:hypothetical protein [Caulobacteraceae bacterium]